jgi:2-hydroxychromene-2-carboxylate isomerase
MARETAERDNGRMPEFPRPVRLPGRNDPPAEPYSVPHDEEVPDVVDADVDLFGAEAAAAQLTARIQGLEPSAAAYAADGRAILSPPFSADRDRLDGFAGQRVTLVVFGAFGTPWSRDTGRLLARVRDHHRTSVRIVWRHFPDPVAHPRAAVLALASEVAGAQGRFWALARELLSRSHDDPADLHDALVHSGLDPAQTIERMQAGEGADRIVDDVASALASGVTSAPALFIDGVRYIGEPDPAALSRALAGA